MNTTTTTRDPEERYHHLLGLLSILAVDASHGEAHGHETAPEHRAQVLDLAHQIAADLMSAWYADHTPAPAPTEGREITIRLSAAEVGRLAELSADWGVAPADLCASLIVERLDQLAAEVAVA